MYHSRYKAKLLKAAGAAKAPVKSAKSGQIPFLKDDVPHPMNPYRLAELVSGKLIDWSKVPDPMAVVESTLGVKRQDIFSPSRSRVLFSYPTLLPTSSWQAAKNQGLAPSAPPGSTGSTTVAANPATMTGDQILAAIGRNCVQWGSMVSADQGRWLTRTFGFFNNDIINRVNSYCNLVARTYGRCPFSASIDSGYILGGSHTIHGAFYNVLPAISPSYQIKYFEAVQGALPDCYFVAAMASVAFVRPNTIRMNVTGSPVDGFYHSVLYGDNPLIGPGARTLIAVTGSIPMGGSGVPGSTSTFALHELFAKNNLGDNNWPGVLEKAHAAWMLGSYDPDCTDITGALAHPSAHNMFDSVMHITGTQPVYHVPGTDPISWLRSRSSGGRATVPLVAGTNALLPIISGPTDLVPGHAYSVLGVADIGTRPYVIVRNPWGVHHPWGTGTPLSSRTSRQDILDASGVKIWTLGQDGVGAVDGYNFTVSFYGGLIFGAE